MSGENIQRVFIVEERDNPSTDYFVLPQFQDAKFNVEKFNFDELPKDSKLAGVVVVFVRYLPKKWRKLITNNRALIKELYFFMDDDLFDLSATQGQPLKYRWKLFRLSYRHQAWLKKQAAKLLVSNSYLVNKYSQYHPQVLDPQPLAFQKQTIKAFNQAESSASMNEQVCLFYHGSASHQAEIDWLYPVVKAVLNKCPQASFEMIGTAKMAKLFLNLDRVTVIPPMSWPAYQAFIQQPGRQIGLAPVLDTAFNRARSYTKMFDITTAGAVGVYSEKSIFADFAFNQCSNIQEIGCFIPMDVKSWVNEIVSLIENHAKRTSMQNSAQELVLQCRLENHRKLRV